MKIRVDYVEKSEKIQMKYAVELLANGKRRYILANVGGRYIPF